MVRIERRGAVGLVVLDRPERRNALDGAACRALAEAVAALAGEGSRALVLAGAGPHFCAGADLSGVEDASFALDLRGALTALAEASVTTIAAVHGAALGAGTQLAIACDLRVGEADARFGIPAARLGLMVDHWTVQRLALYAGFGPARAMLLAAEELDGRAAHALGLVQRLAPAGGVLDAALAWAGDIARLAPLTIAGHKVALNGLEQPVGDDPAVAAAFRRAWESADLAEGMAARAARRSPEFRGR
jgi:enoyl-CoA hydratase